MNEQLDAHKRQAAIPILSLFTSVGTLLCCALPALLVTLGAGATLASLIGVVPWITALSKYKIYTFGVAGVMLVIAGIMRYKARNLPCPADKELAEQCARLRRVSAWIYGFSVLVYLVGFFFAFIAARLLY